MTIMNMKSNNSSIDILRNDFCNYVRDEVSNLAKKILAKAAKKKIVFGHKANFIRDFSYISQCHFDESKFNDDSKDLRNGLLMVAFGLLSNDIDLAHFCDDYDGFGGGLIYQLTTKNEVLDYIKKHNDETAKRLKIANEEKEKKELKEYLRLKRKFGKHEKDKS